MNSDQIRKIRSILGVCLLVGVVVYLLTRNVEGISVVENGDYMSFSYSTGESFDIGYKDIQSVTEIQGLDLGEYVSGIETKRSKFGVWNNSKYGEYNLCIYTNVDCYIVVETSNNIYVLNFGSEEATHSFYKAFLELVKEKQVEAVP